MQGSETHWTIDPGRLVQTMWLTRWQLQEESVQIDWIPGRIEHLG